jgi:hypothetical protein
MATQPVLPNKQCYKCGQSNPAQAFCGTCGSPLVLDELGHSEAHKKDALLLGVLLGTAAWLVKWWLR